MDFGRQPKPVTVFIDADDREDAVYWLRELMQRAGFKGDQVVRRGNASFTIYPNAIND